MSLHALVIDTAGRYPDRVAVAGAGSELTYHRLDADANAMAHRLARLGVRRGDRVVIWVGKSPRAVVAMQAVLRLGAVYVPIDAATPLARAVVVLRDCAARVVCSTGPRLALISAELGDERSCVDLEDELEQDTDPVNEEVSSEDLAYLLYTSGSTGTPKGVCISHGNACAFVGWAVRDLEPRPEDRFANHASLAFDLSVLDLYAAFAVGASVHLIPSEASGDPHRLVAFLHEERISVWYSVPSALILMITAGGLLRSPAPDGLRALLFAGEPFPIPHVRELADWTRARLLNLYGPTETNVCTAHEVTPDDLKRDRPVPIGTATCGDIVWAVHPDGTLAGPGEEGELLVEGPTVMRGYWGTEPQLGPYRTGDVVRLLPDGSLDYIGRRDHTVKVRGNRLNLGDVEATLNSHPSLADSAVVVVGSGIEARLAAFVVPRADEQPKALGLRRHCAQRLPPYAIPDYTYFMDALPRTGNGKVDRQSLTAHHYLRRAAGNSVEKDKEMT